MTIRMAVVLIVTAASLTAQTVAVSPPTPLTNTRYGPVGLPAMMGVASNGRTFVAVWQAGNLVRTTRLSPSGSAGIGIPIGTGIDRPAIAAVDDGYVVAMIGRDRHIRLRFLDENGIPVGPESAPIDYGFRPKLVVSDKQIALFYSDSYVGAYKVVLFDHNGTVQWRTSVSTADSWITDFAAATDGASFKIILSNGHDVYVASLSAFGAFGPMTALQLTPFASGLLVEASIAGDGHGYLAAWNAADGKLNAARIEPSGVVGSPVVIASPATGLAIRRPKLVWNGRRYSCAWLEGGGHDENLVFGTPHFAEIDGASMTATPLGGTADQSSDVQVAASPERWLATWAERTDFKHYLDGSGAWGGLVRGAFVTGTNAEPFIVSKAATEEWMPASASNGSSSLVAWLETANERTNLMCGLVGPGRSWQELGPVAAIENVPSSIVIASNGSDYLVGWNKSVVRIDASGGQIDRTALAVPFNVSGAAWDGHAYILVGENNHGLAAVTFSSSGTAGTVRNIRPSMPAESAGNPRIASSGDGSLVTFARTGGLFPAFSTSVSAIALDRDLMPRGSELMLADAQVQGTAVTWNGSEYLVITCRNKTVISSRISREGQLLDGMPRVIHDHGQSSSPFEPALAATSSGYVVAWRLIDFSGLSSAYVALLRSDGTPLSSARFETELVSAPVVIHSNEQTAIVASSFRSSVPFYGASRVELFHVGDGGSPPAAPQLAAFGRNGRYTIEWTPVAGSTGHRVEYRIGDDAWQEVESWFSPAQNKLDLTVQDHPTLFHFRVRALGLSGPSRYSNEVTLGGSRRRAVR